MIAQPFKQFLELLLKVPRQTLAGWWLLYGLSLGHVVALPLGGGTGGTARNGKRWGKDSKVSYFVSRPSRGAEPPLRGDLLLEQEFLSTCKGSLHSSKNCRYLTCFRKLFKLLPTPAGSVSTAFIFVGRGFTCRLTQAIAEGPSLSSWRRDPWRCGALRGLEEMQTIMGMQHSQIQHHESPPSLEKQFKCKTVQ